MPAYVAIEVKIHDSATYDRYKVLAPAGIAAYGGTYLVRGGTTTTLEGDWTPERFVLLQFPDAESAKAWWASPEYSPAKKLRHECAKTRMILIDGPAFDPSKG